MKLYPLALLAGLLPLITIHLCYGLAAFAGHVNACVPYIHSCTSISSAGRLVPEFYVFKGLMIPAALIIMAFWFYARRWLIFIGHVGSGIQKPVVILGVTACLGLILYSVMLGEIGPEYRSQRRLGVICFFLMSFIAQTLFVVALTQVTNKITGMSKHINLLKSFLLLIILFALSAIIISGIDSSVYDSIEDAFEWWVTLILCLFPLVVGMMWKRSDFNLSLVTNV